MTIIFTTLKKILFWSYDRGTWQYDVMCVLILAFVFLAPASAFQNRPDTAARAPVFISRDALGPIDSSSVEREIARYLSEQYGYEVTVSSIEPMTDSAGNLRGFLTRVSADRATARN